VSAVKGLRVLMAGKNRISAISNLAQLRKLDVLDLHSNDIHEIQGLHGLTDLRVRRVRLGLGPSSPPLLFFSLSLIMARYDTRLTSSSFSFQPTNQPTITHRLLHHTTTGAAGAQSGGQQDPLGG
jgi:hypothetical protein